tara:strand:- start:1011 stop:1262 length:252 start_codon:yes stop_codon:yes gene_type:complete
MTLTETGLIIVVGSIGAIITVLFRGLRMSRCVEINCLWGLLKCSRKNLTVEEYQQELSVTPPQNSITIPKRPPLNPKPSLEAL